MFGDFWMEQTHVKADSIKLIYIRGILESGKPHFLAVENKYGSNTSDASCNIQSTPIISKLKGPCDTLRDICTSTYQIFRIEENTNRTTKFLK